jgi:hypothetical protein
VCLVPLLALAQTATDPFALPTLKPHALITANSLFLKDGIIKLSGNVKAVQASDTLTCQIALMRNSPLWVLASVAPRLHRLEDVKEKKASRETVVDALSILYQGVSGAALPEASATGMPSMNVATGSGTATLNGPQVISLGSAGISLLLTASGSTMPETPSAPLATGSSAGGSARSSAAASMSAFQSKIPTIVGTFSAGAIPKDLPLAAFAGVPGSSTASETIPVQKELRIKQNPLELLKQLSGPASRAPSTPEISQNAKKTSGRGSGQTSGQTSQPASGPISGQTLGQTLGQTGSAKEPKTSTNPAPFGDLNQLANLGNLNASSSFGNLGTAFKGTPLTQLGQMAQTGNLKQLGQGLQVLSQIGPAAQGLTALKDAERALQIYFPTLSHGLPMPLPWKKLLGESIRQALQQTVTGLLFPAGIDLQQLGLSLPEQLSGVAPAALTHRLGVPESLVSEPGIEAESLLVPELEASGAVTVRIDERTWDMATHTWIIIQSEMVRGYKNPNTMKFYGDVRVKDKDHFGRGRKLTYYKASNTVILQGDAHIETERWNQKEKKFEMHILDGETVTYNLETKQATSE